MSNVPTILSLLSERLSVLRFYCQNEEKINNASIRLKSDFRFSSVFFAKFPSKICMIGYIFHVRTSCIFTTSRRTAARLVDNEFMRLAGR